VSLRVLVIPEDPTDNGYILKPLVQALMAAAGRPRAIVNVLSSPRLTGYDHAVRALKGELPGRYAHYDLWLFMPDADRASDAAMAALEAELHAQGIALLACPARPEEEIFACVAHRAELGLHWSEAREHRNFKEQVFEPLLARRGGTRRPGGGRDMLIAASLGSFQAMLQFCPELARLLGRIREQVKALPED
jgi:hypothetical protein